MQETLSQQLRDVAKRFRQRRLWTTWGILAFLLVLGGVVLLKAAWRGQVQGDYAAVLLASVACALFVFDWVATQLSFRNSRWIANQIESAFPSLGQRLLTSLQLLNKQTTPDRSQLGYLQSRVIQETRDHSQKNAWTETVSSSGLRYGKLGSLVSTLMLGVVMALLVAADPGGSTAARLRKTPTRAVIVEPGNVEIERGSGLAVTAKFAQDIPPNVDFFSVDESGEERRVSMTRSLDDPLFGVFVTETKRSFDYQVETSLWKSERYHVEVFDFPELLRSDAYLEFPNYTGMSDRVVEDAVRVTAVEGSQLTWRCFVNKPLIQAVLVDQDNNRVEMSLSDEVSKQWDANFELVANRKWNLELTDEKGRRNKLPITLSARVTPNKPAQIKLAGVADATVSPLQELPLAADVEDDFGIVRSGLAYTFADEAEAEFVLSEKLAGAKKHRIDQLVDFEKLRAVPDQLMAYYFWAEDMDARGERRRTMSDLCFVDVRPFEEVFRQGETPPGGEPSPPSPQAQQAEELLELQKQIISATWNVLRSHLEAQLSKDKVADVDVIKQSQLDAAEQLNELMKEVDDAASREFAEKSLASMTTASEQLTETVASSEREKLELALVSERAAYESLLKLRAKEFEVAKRQQSQPQPGSASQARKQQKLDELELENDENRYESQSQASESPEETQAAETRQILNRLKDLARRQSDLNDQLAQLQSALEQAEDEKEQEEIKRRLERLREQQEELLRETDELNERMQQSESSPSSEPSAENESQPQDKADAMQQLEQARSNVQQATEALRKDDASTALAAGTRAEQQFESLRDDFRKEAASEFEDIVKQMREDAQKLESKQEELNDKLAENELNPGVGLRKESSDSESAEELIEAQQQRLAELMQRMQETVEQSESSEPLLADKLYESHREAQQRGIDRQLSSIAELQRRGMTPQAQAFGEEANSGITKLKEGLEDAAQSVLGDPSKSLERALGELDRLTRDLDAELDERDPARQNESSEAASDDDEPKSPGEPQSTGEPSSRQNQSPGDQQPSNAPQQRSGNQSRNAPGLRGETGGAQSEVSESGAAAQQFSPSSPSAAPIAGDGFREWTDGLREIEELLEQPELKTRAAQIRDRARDVRMDLRRHSKEPKWDLVEDLIAKPLRELKAGVTEELMRRSASKMAPVPIDRDPVPDEFTDAVKGYYESLGSGR